MSRNVLRGGVQLPLGYIFEFDPTGITNAPDLSTADKVHDYFGYGTWEAYGAGRTTIGVSSGHAIGSEGGEENHVLTIKELPAHHHDEFVSVQGYEGWSLCTTTTYCASLKYNEGGNYYGPGASLHMASVPMFYAGTGDTGYDDSHNNMQPYRTVYRWRRIA